MMYLMFCSILVVALRLHLGLCVSLKVTSDMLFRVRVGVADVDGFSNAQHYEHRLPIGLLSL
jgi:hypothetical protein